MGVKGVGGGRVGVVGVGNGVKGVGGGRVGGDGGQGVGVVGSRG